MRLFFRITTILALALVALPIGCKDANTVSGPPGPAQTYTVSGSVRGGGTGAKTVWIVDGPQTGLSALADASGNYQLTGVAPGTVHLEASASSGKYQVGHAVATVPPNAVEVDLFLQLDQD